VLWLAACTSEPDGGARAQAPATHQALPSRRTELAQASRSRLPADLAGVFLGMDEDALKAARPSARRHPRSDAPDYYVYHERRSPAGQVLYLFQRSTQRLARVQLAEQLPDDAALPVRIQRLQQRFGAPSGIWDCPMVAGQLPTRRFSWTRGGAGDLGIMDVVLLLGPRVLATTYFGEIGDIQGSLRSAGCVPTPPERLSKFPALPIDGRGSALEPYGGAPAPGTGP
jgi:hypothetical protein